MARAKRRTLYPLPVQELFENPEYVALTAAGRGMLLSILEHFWRTECRPLPTSDAGLTAIARTHQATWAHQREQIKRILGAVTPGMAHYRERRITGANVIALAAHRGGSAAAARKTQRAAEQRLAALPSAQTAPSYAGPAIPTKEKAPANPRPLPPEKRDQRPRISDRPNR